MTPALIDLSAPKTILGGFPIAASESGGTLVSPNVGLMIWTLLVFGTSMLLLAKFAFPKIQDALDRRQRLIEDSIDTAERTKQEAQELLSEYRERLDQARTQAEEIVDRARKSSQKHETEVLEEARRRQDEMMEHARRDIESETKRALEDIRSEVADLTIRATEKVTRKVLTSDDQRQLVQDAVSELNFAGLSQENSR